MADAETTTCNSRKGTPMSIQVLAHRGASRAERENTVAAFECARRMGAHGVELDVRRTADDVLVVHHDPLTTDSREIRQTQSAALPEHIPTLDQALDACAGMWVNLEIKNDASEPDFDPSEWVADETMALLARRGEPERWLMSSFRIETMDRCRVVAPAVRTAWLVSIVPDDAVATLLAHGHVALHPWVHLLSKDVVDRCHAAGIEVNTWTCDDPVRMRELIDWGIDGICTNVPDIALVVLAETTPG
jgi:glycerophosphoryl diester phosphodiesterase